MALLGLGVRMEAGVEAPNVNKGTSDFGRGYTQASAEDITNVETGEGASFARKDRQEGLVEAAFHEEE